MKTEPGLGWVKIPSLLLAALCGWMTAAAELPDLPSAIRGVAAFESGKDNTPLRQLSELKRAAITDPALRDKLEQALIGLVTGTATFEGRLAACQALAVVGSESSVNALAGLLAQPDTVDMACFALAVNPSATASQVLIAALPQYPGRSRIALLNALGTRRDLKSVTAVSQWTSNTDSPVIEAAVVALGQIGGREAAEELFALRRQAEPWLRPALAEATLRLAANYLSEQEAAKATELYEALLRPPWPDYVRRAALANLLQLDAAQAEARILSVLRSSDRPLIPTAIAGVATAPSRTASLTFAEELRRLAPDDQILLVEALARRGDEAALGAVGRATTSTNSSVRIAAIEALGEFGSAWSVPVILRALTSSTDPAVRQAAEFALARLPGDRTVDQAILDQWARLATNAKPAVIAALSRRGCVAAVPLLLPATSMSDAPTRRAAWQALGRLSRPEDVPPLLDRLAASSKGTVPPEAEEAISQALSRIPDPAARSTILRSAYDRESSPDLRASLLVLMVQAPDEATLALVSNATRSTNAVVAAAAERAAADWPTLAAWDLLVRFVSQEGGANAATRRTLALRGLARLAGDNNAQWDTKSSDRYSQLFGLAQTDPERKLILGALSSATDPAALLLVTPFLDQPAVRPEAEQAVRKIAEAVKVSHPQAAEAALSKLK